MKVYFCRVATNDILLFLNKVGYLSISWNVAPHISGQN